MYPGCIWRRAREAREAREAHEAEALWEAQKPTRLLHALARADQLGVPARVFYRYENVLYFAFGDDSKEGMGLMCDTVAELSEHMMTIIETSLQDVANHQAHQRRLQTVKAELLERLSDVEKEALGLR
jgi:hypothetical protein